MATNYSPTIVTDGAVFVGDALMPSTATSATKLYNRAGSGDGTMYAGTCLDFDGTDDYISIPDDSTLDITGDMTVSCWVALDSSENGNLCMLVNKRDAGDTASPFFLFFEDRSGQNKFGVLLGGGSPNYVVAGSNDNFDGVYGKWDHVCFTVSGTTVSMYVNGVFDASGTFTGSRQTNNVPLRLGGQYTNGSNNYMMAGQMADVRIYDVALSAADVKKIYDDSKVIVPSNVSQTNLKCWVPLSEGAGTTTYDGSGNGNNGTMTNMTSTDWLNGQTGAPQLIQGYNRPMLFDGTNDYVTAGNPAALQFTWADNFSLSAWIWKSSAAGGFDHIIGKTYGNYRLAIDSSQQLSFRLDSNGLITASGSIPNNTWTHVAATWATNSSDGGTAKIYINGSLSTTQTGTASWTSGNGDFQIGNSYGESYYFNGLINECIAYNKTLSLAEVQVLAATGPNGGPLPPDPRGLSDSSNALGYWRNDSITSWPNLGSSANVGAGTPSGSPSALLFVQGYNGQNNTKSGRDSQGFPLKNKNNGAIGFNGSDDYVNVADSSLWDATGGISVGGWCYANSLGSYNVIVNQWSTAANSSSSWTLETVGSDWRFYMYDSGAATLKYASSTGTATTGAWKHIVGVFNGVTRKVYVNGVEGGTTATVTTANTSSFPLRLGRFYDTATGSWDGQIACTQIYNRALSRAEILQNYNAQKSRFT